LGFQPKPDFFLERKKLQKTLGFQPKPDFFLERKKQRTFMRNYVSLMKIEKIGEKMNIPLVLNF